MYVNTRFLYISKNLYKAHIFLFFAIKWFALSPNFTILELKQQNE